MTVIDNNNSSGSICCNTNGNGGSGMINTLNNLISINGISNIGNMNENLSNYDLEQFLRSNLICNVFFGTKESPPVLSVRIQIHELFENQLYSYVLRFGMLKPFGIDINNIELDYGIFDALREQNISLKNKMDANSKVCILSSSESANLSTLNETQKLQFVKQQIDKVNDNSDSSNAHKVI